jgi:hypothetical protein
VWDVEGVLHGERIICGIEMVLQGDRAHAAKRKSLKA